MRQIFCVLTAVLTLLLLCGCTESSAEYAPLSDIFSGAETLADESYQNLRLPAHIAADVPTHLYTFQSVPSRPGNTDDVKALLTEFVTALQGTCDPESIALATYNSSYYRYLSQDSSFYAVIGADKKYFTAAQDLSDGTEAESFWNLGLRGRDAVYHTDRGDSLDGAAVSLGGTQYPLTDAKQYADALVQDKLLAFTGYSDARLRTISVCETGDGGQMVQLGYEFLVDGVPVNLCGDESGQPLSVVRTGLYIEMQEPGRYTDIHAYHSAETDKKQALTGEFVTLRSALRLAEAYLAPEHVYNVADVGICYTALADYHEGADVIRYAPAWRIILAEADRKDTHIVNPAEPCVALYVDMQTAKICVYDMMNTGMTDFSQYGITKVN